VAAYEKEVHKFYLKDEYESTAVFEERTKEGPKLRLLSNSLYYHFVLENVKVVFDADQMALILSGVQSEGYDGKLIKNDRELNGSEASSASIRIAPITRKKKSYVGQNAYGVKRNVIEIRGTDLYFKVDNRNFKNVTKHYGVNAAADVLFRHSTIYLDPVAENIGLAKKCQKVAVITAHLDTFAAEFDDRLYSSWHSAEIGNPIDEYVIGKDVPMVLDYINLLCADTRKTIGVFNYANDARNVIGGTLYDF
jgi:hypothetical protein